MTRLGAVVALCALLPACDRQPSYPTAATMASAPVRSRQAHAEPRAAMMAYTYTDEIEVAADWVERHFIAARDRCVAPCVVLNSQIDQRPDGLRRPSATLTARLPHDGLPAFRDAALSPLPGEPPGGVEVRSQAGRAEDLSRVIEDGGRRLQQLRDYRERLTALAARPDPLVADLIKTAEALSQVQSQIEAAEAEQRSLQERVDTEQLTIRYSAVTARAGAWAPVTEVWSQAGVTLGTATAEMVYGVLIILPWIPLLALLAVVIGWAWTRRRRR